MAVAMDEVAAEEAVVLSLPQRLALLTKFMLNNYADLETKGY